ncbi:hypothetical protein HMPREF9104_00623 [Lentilactobacillus kisonensis F0435]|uniref:Uncharacterized protein n=1 Tax=Lentilactobacillus kisonensis F0435 TaxID=797516 RepID=H1LDF9_9LACO|nr:hypothetical protein HMPREF9104_00623 [Lentilactobacillus kisonensis F0435]
MLHSVAAPGLEIELPGCNVCHYAEISVSLPPAKYQAREFDS